MIDVPDITFYFPIKNFSSFYLNYKARTRIIRQGLVLQ